MAVASPRSAVPESTHSEVPRSFAVNGPSISFQPLILALGLNQILQSDSFRTICAENAHGVYEHLRDGNPAVLVLGPQLTSVQVLEILTRCATEQPASTTVTIVLCAGPEPELFQKFVDEGIIYYLSQREIPIEQLRSLVTSCRGRMSKKADDLQNLLTNDVPNADQLLDLSVRLPMQTNIPSAAALVVQKLRESIDANYVQCFIHDAEEDTLTPADALENKEVSYSAASGLTAFAVRTGERVILERVGTDPRYDADIDNPIGTSNARFVAEPILGTGGMPLAVITAMRSEQSPQFSARDLRFIHSVAECAAPAFSQLVLQKQTQAQLTRRAAALGSNSDIFRQEALEYHIRSWDQQGDVIKTLPAWLRTSYWIVLALVLIGLAGLALIPGIKNFFGKVL